ncbi:sugar MFS transporter [Gramella sp. AN32]|uniref:Sugar MFS transporter n=1 Tax=Christiangramia antarctica TaxID=2058158 RepID=A0ABW5X1X4_9FLAO|nr:sugar MFS transporter [Gramella sp. AN32]MCM4155752.1 glucose/galactose MFS transporter [Gramella sp. AN32]
MKYENSNSIPVKAERKSTFRSIMIIGILFFIFGFITWLNSVLVPYLKIACELNNFQSYFVVTSFYISYLVMALPSAWILKITGLKKGMSLGLLIMAIGAFIFIPAAYTRTYEVFLLGLFILGTGLAVLQTAANPYITILGPIESAAKRISIMGICNKVAGALAPIVLGAILLDNMDGVINEISNMNLEAKEKSLDMLSQRVVLPYLIMMGVLIFLSIMIYFSPLPDVDTDTEKETGVKQTIGKKNIFQFPQLLLGALAMFLYVGVEVIAGDTVISYALSLGIDSGTAKLFTTYTLVAMIVGYLIGIVIIPKYISQEKALSTSAVVGIVFSSCAIFTEGFISVLFISLLGLANALVFPAIWPLAINGLGKFTKIGSSFLIMALAGGAIIPLGYGYLADLFNAKTAYWIVIPCYLFLGYYSIKGYKIRFSSNDKNKHH